MRTCSYYFRKRVLPLALSTLDDAMNAQATPNARTQGFENGYCGVSNVELHNVAGVGGFYPVFVGSCIECRMTFRAYFLLAGLCLCRVCTYRSRGLAAGSCAVYVRYLQESWVLLLTGDGAVYWA